MKIGSIHKLLALALAMMMIVASMGIAAAQSSSETPLVVGYEPFSQKFSPFFADTGYDQDVTKMTHEAALLTTDRMGGIIYNAIEGETVPFNGKDYTYKGMADVSVKYDEAADITTYTAKLRDDIKFSDGVPMTIDDLIFSYYVYLDPSYVGSTTLNSYKILGLQAYQTQIASDIYTKYSDIAKAILAAGDQHVWSSADAWTEDQQKSYWEEIKASWMDDVQAIVNFVNDQYAKDYAKDTLGYTAEEVAANEGLKMALGIAVWGFGKVGEKEDKSLDGILTTKSGVKFDIANGVYPTLEDYYNEVYAAYEKDPVKYWETENKGDVDTTTVVSVADTQFITKESAKEPNAAAGVPNIEGIKKIDDYTVEVKTQGYEAPAVYSILGIQVSPLHYYGDPAQYDYANNKFGHPFGDLSIVSAKTTQPMGAGPYKFVKYENRIVYFEANEYYYKGAPKTKYLQFKETAIAEVAAGVATGTIDMGEMSGSKTNFEAVAGYNSNKEITGDVITTTKVDNLGYGYIGMNADTMNVAGEPASDASKNLRRAFATVLAVYRDVAYDSYYGEAASVINYPISNTSWAAPQPTDEGYKVAFSVDVEGKDIYTSDMKPEQKYTAAIEAAKGFLKAAGYTFDDATGKFTAAPEGASLSYEVLIPGQGNGAHPSFALLTDAKNALETIGITLKINDPADSNVMWDALDAGTQNMWCAAWGATIDPDMYQVYHSSSVVGKGGSDSNHYHIVDADLDAAIIDARKSDDQAYRKAVYKTALDIIVDWAVEVPAYQRQNCTVFSTQRINMDTVTPDITTFWLWQNDIELAEMK
jgi:peptide/nickel transport system substrate-binding protein